MIQAHDKTALVYRGREFSYSQLLQYSLYYANCFGSIGSGSKLLIFADNSPQWVFAFYAAMRLGVVVVPVDIQSTVKELAYILRDCEPEMIFCTEAKKTLVRNAIDSVEGCKCATVTEPPIDLAVLEALPVTEIHISDPERLIVIVYTSGTTGTHKGVMLNYKNIHYNIYAVTHDVPIFRKECNVMVLLPLTHILPLLGTVMIPLYAGNTIYIAEGLSGDAILKVLNEGKINIIIGVPRLYDTLSQGIMRKINARLITKIIYQLVKLVGIRAVSRFVFKSVHETFGGHLEFLVSGGASLPDATARIFRTLGFYILEGYGMTETAPMISFTRPGKWKIGYAGEPLNGIEVISDEFKEICVRGDNVMEGYYNRPEETAEIIRDGWLHTGDIGFLDKNGIKITGRIKDIIITPNGKNINPELVETSLMAFSPYIAEVGVFAQNDVLQAIIIPKMVALRELSSVENIHEFFKEEIAKYNRETPPYKRIKQIHIVSEELPKTRVGKIQRFKLPFLAVGRTASENKSEDLPESESRVYSLLKAFIEEEVHTAAKANDHFEIDLAMDSLSRVALIAYIESAFGIALNEERMEELNTLLKLARYVEEHSAGITEKEISWKEILSSPFAAIKLPKAGFVHRITNYIIKIILNTTYRYRGLGEQNIPEEPCIFVANHSSALDGVIITARMSLKTAQNTFLFAKEKYWRTRFARFMAGKNNIITMDINKNLRQSLQQMSCVLQQGKNVIIFPEGTRSKTQSLNHFKETFAILSTELRVPVVPVIIEGSEKATFRPIKIPRFFARIRVEFLKPVYPDDKHTPGSFRDKIVGIMQGRLPAGKNP
ncbi:MAG: AMP-binding protein [Tannerella sp.]|nr:AMP-binding protein [Tannerella sp.]